MFNNLRLMPWVLYIKSKGVNFMEQKTKLIHSIKTKVALMVATSIFLATCTILVILIPYMSRTIETENKNYLLDVVKGNGHIMEMMKIIIMHRNQRKKI